MGEAVEFIDECTVHVQGGRGGSGVASFRREAHVPRGGPDGGDGGDGGDVVFVAASNVTSLLDLHRSPHRAADAGGHGEGDLRTGKTGKEKLVKVPVGTVIRDRETGELIGDLVTDGQRLVVAPGGRGGRGNAAFANRHRRLPKFHEYGEEVPERLLRLELKLIADVGLVGFPSAGKSSLITRVSNAKPRIEAWHFTTLTPHLGVVRAGDDRHGNPIDIVMADVPGLIEGASEGKGLGHQFLRHIERCSVLLHVVDCFPFDPERDPIRDLAVLREELRRHEPALLQRPQVVALNKVDLPDGRAMAELARPDLAADGFEVFEVSAASGEGLDALRYRLGELVSEHRTPIEQSEGGDEEIVLRLTPIGNDFTVTRDPASGHYVVAGRRIERWVQMLPLTNLEAARYLQGRLRRAGVERALIEAGAREGDEVGIRDIVFDFDPDLADLPPEERLAVLAAEAEDEAAGDGELIHQDWRDLEGPDELEAYEGGG